MGACASTPGEGSVPHRNFWHSLSKDFGRASDMGLASCDTSYQWRVHIAVRDRLSFPDKVILVRKSSLAPSKKKFSRGRSFLRERHDLTVNRNLVDPASSHMLVSKIKPCMSQNKSIYGESANGSLKQL